jgi:hypothetical protein
LRTLSRSREDYVGEWLPEPLLTSPDVAEDELAAVSLVVEDGRITRVYLVRNPRKLTRLDEPVDLAR